MSEKWKWRKNSEAIKAAIFSSALSYKKATFHKFTKYKIFSKGLQKMTNENDFGP